jgi:hypothetical protein
VLVWWGSQVECVSALTRLERAGALDTKAVSTSFERLKQLADSWHEVEPGGIVAESAVRFLRFIRYGQPTLYNLRLRSSQQAPAALAAIRNARWAARRCRAQGRFRAGRYRRGLRSPHSSTP